VKSENAGFNKAFNGECFAASDVSPIVIAKAVIGARKVPSLNSFHRTHQFCGVQAIAAHSSTYTAAIASK
jgi:hypothetical protein